jgi:23S rRNA-/tRNA-specific pseudouridylate synthase
VAIVCREETTVGDVLARLGEGAEKALDDGRIFIGARRAASSSDAVAAGDEVLMYAARAIGLEAPRILLEREGIVAAYKPAAMPTVADHHGAAGTLEREIAAMLGSPARALVPTSRLDVGVSGVVLFAADDDARKRLARAREQGRYRRHYVAIVRGAPAALRGEWAGSIGRARDPRRRLVDGRDAVHAETVYAVVASVAQASLLAIEPRTGRTHQIRVHAAHAGCPVFGDEAYGGPLRIVSERGAVRALTRIALHAAWVEVPVGSETLRVHAPIPDDLAAIWTDCGGDPSAWELAFTTRLAPAAPSLRS